MSLSAAVIRELVAAGLSGHALVEACERIEASSPVASRAVDEQAERRRAADRERKRLHDPALATPRLPDRDWWPLRKSVIERDGFACVYCGAGENLCADHVVPLSRGGSNEPSNLVCACLPCNSSKSDRLLTEWQGRYQ